MAPQFLRSLQAAIMVTEACAPHVVTNDMGKVDGAATKDMAIADILNANGYAAGSKAMSCHLAKKLLIKRGRWRGIVRAANDDAHPAVEAAYAAFALAEDARMDADFNDAAAGPLLDALVSASLISADDKAVLQAMCATPSTITAAQVSRALRGPWGDERE